MQSQPCQHNSCEFEFEFSGTTYLHVYFQILVQQMKNKWMFSTI